MSPRDRLLSAVREAATELPAGVVSALCDALDALAVDAPITQRKAVISGLAPMRAREVAARVMECWCVECPDMTSGALAMALRAAAVTDDYHRKRQGLELVWTGPTAPGTALRRIDQGLLEVFRSAKTRLLVVTFAAWREPVLALALSEALDRGVRVSLVVETRESSDGRYSGDAREALGEAVFSRADVFVWPAENRPRDEHGRTGALHAKCALADDAVLLMSSANLTAHAMTLNMELGVLVSGGELPTRVGGQFDALIAAGVLVRAPREG